MAKRKTAERGDPGVSRRAGTGRPSALIDTRLVYCGDCLDQLRKLPDGCVDRLYLWHRLPAGELHGTRNYEVFWGRKSEPRAPASGLLALFEDRPASTQAYIDHMRPRCVELARVLKKTGSFHYHCDWRACHYVKVKLDQNVGFRGLSQKSAVRESGNGS
jgi:site-specific DNA-methyltransferase (adenine-specific)